MWQLKLEKYKVIAGDREQWVWIDLQGENKGKGGPKIEKEGPESYQKGAMIWKGREWSF